MTIHNVFNETSCSQCGKGFGVGTSGFSHCDNHEPKQMVELHNMAGHLLRLDSSSTEGLAALWAKDEIDRLRSLVRQILDARESGSLQMSSPEIGGSEIDMPHPWHEEWLRHASAALPATQD